ncbi:MAG TPA: LTA synthase family protein [Bacteroidaceae bacterium]|nr:LTA synthase family protein [Bacteroidaceae bacterium]
MFNRAIYILKYYLVLLAIFVVEKPLFMLSTADSFRNYQIQDYFQVIIHGLPVDMSVAGYLLIVPLLLTLSGIWWRECPFKQIMRCYNIFIALLLSLVFVSDTALYPFWGFKLDSLIFFYLKSPKEAFASISVWAMLLGLIITLFFSILFYLALNIRLKRVEKVNVPCYVESIPLFMFLSLTFLVIRGGTGASTMNIGKAYFSTDQYLNHAAINPVFSLLESMGKTKKFEELGNFFDESTREDLFTDLYRKEGVTDEFLLKTDRPNILLILLESFSANFVESLGGVPGVAENIENLAKEGVFFTNCYANSFRTDRGMVSILNGYPGLPTESIMKIPSKSRKLSSLTSVLVEKGYSTDFLYGGDVNFTNMSSYLWSNGYQKIVSEKDFSVAQRKSNAWGVNDHITFNYLLDYLTNRKDSLWQTTFLTLSSHEPFIVPFDKYDDKILNAMAYTDHCLGTFVEELKKSDVWNNLLIVMMPDHGFTYPTGTDKYYPESFRIPMIWIGGAIKNPKIIDKIVNQSDMTATILAQMNISHNDFPFSRNVLADNYNYPFAFYSFNNGFAFIDSTGVSIFDNNSGRQIYNQGVMDNGERLNKGKSILQTLYKDLDNR